MSKFKIGDIIHHNIDLNRIRIVIEIRDNNYSLIMLSNSNQAVIVLNKKYVDKQYGVHSTMFSGDKSLLRTRK